MQTVTYQVRLLHVGDHLDINGTQFVVNNYENLSPPYDRMIIRNLTDNTLTRLVIVNGTWQPDFGNTFTINFHDQQVTIQTPQITPQTPQAQRGIFHEAERVFGSRRKTGKIIDYPFVISTIVSRSEIIVDFGPNFSDTKYATYATDTRGVYTVATSNGIRTLTLRQDGTWVFKGKGKLYSGDSIEII